MIGCALFIVGLCVGAALLPFSGSAPLEMDSIAVRRGLAWAIVIQVMITAYVLAVGPTSPLVAALNTDSAFDIAMLREEAIKLNQDPIFVRLYSWGRDIFAPVVFVLSVQALRLSRRRSFKALAFFGILSSLVLGLWSGQKATVLNYVLAAVIFSAASGWSMTKQLAKVVPLMVLALLAIFAITLPQLFSGKQELDAATGILVESVIHRIALVPLEVSAAYIYSIDALNIISHIDVLPLVSELWTPGIGTIENRVGVEFFYTGIDSVSANALAFAYAYVLAGYIGCFLAGVLTVGVLKACEWLVRSSGSVFFSGAYGALLCYLILDLLNGNYLTYLITAILLAVSFWVMGSMRRQQPEVRTPPAQIATDHAA